MSKQPKRTSIGAEVEHKTNDKVRPVLGKSKRLDASFYQGLPEYADKTLFWCNELDGEMERWFEVGAEPVPKRTRATKTFKGINDNTSNEWEFKTVGSDEGGNPIRCYLLVMDAEEYHSVKIAPLIQRQKEISDAMGIGKADEQARVMPNVKGLRTYAPNLPDGGTGLSVSHGSFEA